MSYTNNPTNQWNLTTVDIAGDVERNADDDGDACQYADDLFKPIHNRSY